MNCRQADFIGYSIFLEIFLEMLFSVAFGVPEKSVFTRLFRVFATDMLANFQDFSCYENIPPDRGFCETLSDADFSRVIEEIGVFQ